MRLLRWLTVPLLGGLWAGAQAPARAELLPLECDDGASVTLSYVDTSPEFEFKDELDECNQAPVGDWNRVGLAEETDAATVDAVGFVRSDDGFVLEVTSELALVKEDHELAALGMLAEGHARFHAPEADDDVQADVILEIARQGELEDTELSLAVLGPGVDVFEDLDDEQDGELHFPVELEPGEEYRAILIAGAALTDTASGSQTLRVRVDVPAPEAGAPLLLATGALLLGASRFGGRRRR